MDEYVEIKQKNVINNLITFNKNLYKVDSLKETIGTNEFYFILDKSKELNLKPSTLWGEPQKLDKNLIKQFDFEFGILLDSFSV